MVCADIHIWSQLNLLKKTTAEKLLSSWASKSAKRVFSKQKRQKCHAAQIYNEKKHNMHLAAIVHDVLKCMRMQIRVSSDAN